MTISLFFASTAAIAAANAVSGDDIIVTAALTPVTAAQAPVSVTTFDQVRIDALSVPFVPDLIRTAPGISVATSGGTGALTQIRIRGGEANHTLVFIDGIAFNDTASDDQARFESFPADGLGRIEVIRGPQSAIYGSEALGGVIALNTPDPLGALRANATAEYGSDDFARASASIVSGGDVVGVSASGSYSRADGIDVLGGGSGDKDGFKNYSGSLKIVARPGSDGEIGIVGRYIHHHAEFDGTPPPFYLRGDTNDNATAKTYAIRSWAKLGLADDAAWSGIVEAQYIDSKNHNFDADTPTNDSIGSRSRFGGQLTHRFAFGDNKQTLTARIEREDEAYSTRDLQYGGFGDVDFDRGRTAFIGEWMGSWGSLVSTDIAVRHDAFNKFKDATTIRAHAIVHVTPSIGITGGYGEGISQPGFAELFGYAAASNFVGNPALTPEKSRGFEAGVRWTTEKANVRIVAFSNTLRDEIVYQSLPSPAPFVYPYTYINATGKSRRKGIELSADVQPLEGLNVSANYTYIDADEQKLAGGPRTREIRRAKHSANLVADYKTGPLTVGASLSYVGKRPDLDFDTYSRVMLKDYVLAGGRVAYAITANIEAFARIENALNEKYEDVVGYNTPGRRVYGGIRVKLGE